MKKFLPLLLLTFTSPIAANAESVWLVLRHGTNSQWGSSTALEKIKMSNMSQCELMGAKWMGAKRTKLEEKKSSMFNFGYECLEGE